MFEYQCVNSHYHIKVDPDINTIKFGFSLVNTRRSSMIFRRASVNMEGLVLWEIAHLILVIGFQFSATFST